MVKECEETYLRKEIKRLVGGIKKEEIERQVKMNGFVFKECLKVIATSLIESMWCEDLFDDG